MPLLQPDRIWIACPRCGHPQLESRTSSITICNYCHLHFRLEAAWPKAAERAAPQVERKKVRCFKCGAELAVSVTAASSLCKECRSHVDLANYRITKTVSKKFRTHGRLVIEENGHMLDSDALVGEAVVKGTFTGKLVAEGALEIHSSAIIMGSFTAGRLVIPLGHHFRWPEPLPVEGADISGELAATLQASGTVRLRATARFYGAVQARNLVVEPGAVCVGTGRIGGRFVQETTGNAAS